MRKCSDPAHPHCTVWVMPGAGACAHGHPQPVATLAQTVPAGMDLLEAQLSSKADGSPTRSAPLARPTLHVSGFDPRAAGGRQSVRLALRGMPPGLAPELAMVATSGLRLAGGARRTVTRTLDGEWMPVLLEFSSRGVEHGQHRIDVQLQSSGDRTRTWVCTLVILVPRPDATLTEIHQTFLANHKNVRVTADDGAIARVTAPAGGAFDIDVNARDGSIAQLDLQGAPGGRDVGFATIAWDEELIEVEAPMTTVGGALAHASAWAGDLPTLPGHPWPASAVTVAGVAGQPRRLRVFARDEFVLGRLEAAAPPAHVLLAHFGEHGAERGGLTRRLSARHALVRRGREGFEIEDVSRYGLLVDGAWPGKHVPVPLRPGMRIELTASIRNVVVLVVTAVLPHGVVLHRADAGADEECFVLLEPERRPGHPLPPWGTTPAAPALPLLFHSNGGFWQLDPATGAATAIAGDPATASGRVRQQHQEDHGAARQQHCL